MEFKDLKIAELLNLKETLAAGIFDNVTYAWEVIPKISDYVNELGPSLSGDEYEFVGEDVWISKTANVDASASITGPAIIGHYAEIRHCAYIRGNVLIGEYAVVGNLTEIKNSILFNNVQAPHYNYIGDSVLGYKSHMGAGAITSNVKSDKSMISVMVNSERIDTNLKKFGAILGDGVDIGSNSVLNPGTVVGRNSNIYPLSMVRGFIPRNSIYKKHGEVVEKY
ncbi:MAG: UDP-N-acetylglucosamine pyrophosphorylase [Vallitaleaceae bacterium]|jgi:NDP-sugar pyrophosphorylase family protein|nr:UDP-N-acetylglucosamine pyrophosphorylase [Vallitaleaceae bacterium]